MTVNEEHKRTIEITLKVRANKFVAFCLANHDTFTRALRPEAVDALEGSSEEGGSRVWAPWP